MKTTAIYAYSAGATGLKRLQTWALCGALALAGVLGAGQAAAANDTWEGSTPFATGLGNRVINALAASPDGLTVYAGTGSGTVLRYVYSDTTPDAFSFTAQTGAGLGTVATSNSITVAGINSAASISITGGEYQIGSASWTNSVGTLNIGDTVKVRITAAGSYSTVTQATLTIGSASAVFNVTTTTPALKRWAPRPH
jgi:hypothetical protein